MLLVEEVTRSLKHECRIVNVMELWLTKENQNLLKYVWELTYKAPLLTTICSVDEKLQLM
jgi:hypothetical protein